MAKMYRQGDVLLVKLDKPLDDQTGRPFPRALYKATPKKRKSTGQVGIELALGEATGHAHVVVAPKNQAVLLSPNPAIEKEPFSAEDQRFLQLIEGGELQHEEHDPIALPPGDYEVIQQREFDPELDERPVID